MTQAYQLVATVGLGSGMVQRTLDGAFIPFDPGNRDYQEYLAWLGKGNTPDPAPGQGGVTLPADPTI